MLHYYNTFLTRQSVYMEMMMCSFVSHDDVKVKSIFDFSKE